MQMTDRGLLAVMRHEGIVPGPYLDVKNVWTYGVGHTAAAGPPDPAGLQRGMPADLDTALRRVFDLLRSDLARYEAAVRRAVKVELAPHEFDALVSFHYNTGGIARASLTRYLNAGDRAAAAEAFLNWRRPAAIIPRRKAERDLFRHGRYPGGTIAVWSVDRHGRVDFSRPVRRLNDDEALALLRRPPTPRPPVRDPEPETPTGWLARLAAFFSTLIRRAWLRLPPRAGWRAWVEDEGLLLVYDGAGWIGTTPNVLQNLALLGLGTTADAANPFSAKLNAALWTARTVAEGGTGDLFYTMNKEAAGDAL